MKLSIYRASLLKKRLVDLENIQNMVCGEFVYAYPPGIPILIPGQKVTSEIIDYIKLLKVKRVTLVSSSQEIDNMRLQALDKVGK